MKLLLKFYVFCFILTGCVPIPTKNIDTPSIIGSLYHDERSLGGYDVYLAYTHDNACSVRGGNTLHVVTDKNGEFKIPPTYKWSLVRWAVPADGTTYFNLCFVAPDVSKKWAYISHMRTPSWAPNIKLKCNINKLLSKPEKIDLNAIFKIKDNCSQS